MSHTNSCETASTYTCTCPCGGARHCGLLITGISSSSEHAREKAKDWADERRWGGTPATAKQTTVNNSSAQRRPALTGVITELVSNLINQVREDGEIDAVEVLAKKISDEIADEFEKELTNKDSHSGRSRHLWCVVIATICRTYDEAVDLANESIDELVDHVMQFLREATSDCRTERAAATDIYWRQSGVVQAFDIDEYDWMGALIKRAVTSVVTAVKSMGEETTMKYIRLIGAIICPDPDRHPVVVKHCIWPLLNGPFRESLNEVIASEMRKWLRNAYVVVPTESNLQDP